MNAIIRFIVITALCCAIGIVGFAILVHERLAS